MGKELPKHYRSIKEQYGSYITAVENLSQVLGEQGPIDEKTAQLVQLAAAAAIRSEGSVHSHARRARAAGATQAEIEHVLILITGTIGFPTVMAALQWVKD